MHGGSLRVVAALRSGEPTPELRAIEVYEVENALNDPATWLDIGSRVSRKIESCATFSRHCTTTGASGVMAPRARRRCG